MSKIPSPILIFGDKYLSKNIVIKAKKKFTDHQFETVSFAKDTFDSIRADVGSYDWTETERVIVIEGFANNKDTRDFLLDICQNIPDGKSIILLDSLGSIKLDSRTHKISKGWESFINDFENIAGHKVINNGAVYTEKEESDCVTFIQKVFNQFNKKIETKEANLLMTLVGRDRGILISEIQKMSLTASEYVGAEFIIENAFPLTREAILYKFANVLDSCSHQKILATIEEFVHSGSHPNVLAEIMMKKARWQLAASYFFSQKLPWNIIVDKLMDMGQFPSYVWHNPNQKNDEKKASAEPYQDMHGMLEFMTLKQGLPKRYFKLKEPKTKMLKSGKPSKAKVKSPIGKAERIPMRFMASQTTAFVRDKVVRRNSSVKDIKQAVYNRAVKVYLFTFEKLVEVRTSKDPIGCLREMALALTSPARSPLPSGRG